LFPHESTAQESFELQPALNFLFFIGGPFGIGVQTKACYQNIRRHGRCQSAMG